MLVAADTPFADGAAGLNDLGVEVTPVEGDLATEQGVRRLIDALGGREVGVLVANAGHGLGGAFLEQSFDDWRHVVDTNVVGTLLVIQPVVKAMSRAGRARC